MQSCDALVIGGGPNGLAAAFRLARAGRKTLLVEASEGIGGGARTVEFAPGYRVSGLAHVLHMLDARVAGEMQLGRHGLDLAAPDLATTALAQDGRHLLAGGAFYQHLSGGLDPAEAEAWARMRRSLLRYAAALAPFRALTPPRLAAGAGNPVARLARIGLGLRLMGRADFREFLRVALINVADFLEDDLTDNRLRGALAFDAVLGSWLGPRSPNSLFLLLNRIAADDRGRLALPKGGMGAVAEAMAAAARAAGVEIRTSARVEEILVAADHVIGVRLQGGEQISAGLVVSALAPAPTLLNLVGPRHLDTGLMRRLRVMKSRGGAAKLHLALTGTPDFRGADLKSRLLIAPSVDAVEQAFNPVKYGEVPEAPVMEVILPSAHEPGLAPDGHHVLSAIVQFAPHAPPDRDAARAALLENALAQLERHAPGIRALVAHAELLMPQDIETRYGMPGGNWHHGELSIEQMLFLRPVVGMAQYETPLPGLWLASAGTHPGGGISGASGWNAAGRILEGAR